MQIFKDKFKIGILVGSVALLIINVFMHLRINKQREIIKTLRLEKESDQISTKNGIDSIANLVSEFPALKKANGILKEKNKKLIKENKRLNLKIRDFEDEIDE